MAEPYTITKSEQVFARAQELLPGGVNSPVRAFGSVGGTPRVIYRGEGAHLYDVDGNRYIDYVLSWGPMVLGHCYADVVDAQLDQIHKGTSFGAPTELENELAELVIDLVPSIEMIRFVNSGTEATMSALRLARAHTGREKIIKFAGNYHGHADMLLVQAGSGVATFGLPDSPGVPKGTVNNTLIAPYNDLDAVKALFEANEGEVAAVIAEPIAANMGFVLPDEGYLQGLIDLAHEYGALMILDEVMTGFRVSLGGAQAYFDVEPDITCLGKVIGGGLPVGAYAGKREIMETVAPAGTMYQAGTLSGNPLAMVSGFETIRLLRDENLHEVAAAQAEKVVAGVREICERLGVPVQANARGSMMGFYFLTEDGAVIRDYATAKQYAHTERYATFYHQMLSRGVYLAPSQFEAGFLSAVHEDEDIAHTLTAFEDSLKAIL